MIAITVKAMHATRARSPHQYAIATAAAPPAATGTSGRRMSRVPRARDSSHNAIPTAAAMYARKMAFTVNRVTRARPPSTTPTPSAAGRFRPARTGVRAPSVPSSPGTTGSAAPSAGTSDLEEFGFLVLEQLVHLPHVGVGEIVELPLCAMN